MVTNVVIASMGVVAPLAGDIPALLELMAKNGHGIRPLAHFAGTPFEGRLGGGIVRPLGCTQRGDPTIDFAVRAIGQALSQRRSPLVRERTAIVLGTTMTPRERPVAEIAAELRARLDLDGALTLVVSTACTSSSASVAIAQLLLRTRTVDLVIAGGADELDLNTFAGFHALGLVCEAPCTPFGHRIGTSLGEGAAFFVLERESDALDGSAPLGFLEGTGTTSDAFHATSPHPSGDGLVRAARAALGDAECAPSDVDWISAHGTGTRANDASESEAIRTLFPDRVGALPMSAQKSVFGHALGAAGALELAAALAMTRQGFLPPTVNVGELRPECTLDLVRQPRPRASMNRVLKLGAAFGGANAALVVSLDRGRQPRGRALSRRVFVAGLGGFDGAAASAGWKLSDLVRGVNPRGLDRTALLLIVAVERALADAERTSALPTGGHTIGDKTGLFVGQRRASPESHVEFETSVRERGLWNVARGAFTRKVLNTATGAAARAFSLRGPTYTLSTGATSGLVALALAAGHLATRDDADSIVGASVEEATSDADVADGAAAVSLTTSPSERGVEVVGWSLGGSGDWEGVSHAALARAGLDPRCPIDTFAPPRGSEGRSDGGSALEGLGAVRDAVARLREGRTTHVLVRDAGRLVSAALVLSTSRPQ